MKLKIKILDKKFSTKDIHYNTPFNLERGGYFYIKYNCTDTDYEDWINFLKSHKRMFLRCKIDEVKLNIIGCSITEIPIDLSVGKIKFIFDTIEVRD